MYGVHLLRTVPAVRDEVRARFKYVLVDELQDTNRPQLELLQLLAGAGAGLFSVGDADQAIYGWRGAERGMMDTVKGAFPGTKRFILATNYRSGPSILAARHRRHAPRSRGGGMCDGCARGAWAGGGFDSEQRGQQGQPQRAARARGAGRAAGHGQPAPRAQLPRRGGVRARPPPQPRCPRLATSPRRRAAAAAAQMAQEIRALRRKHNFAYSDFAVLYRQHS